MTPNPPRWLLVVGVTIVAAAVLRVYGLDSGLWYDEISTLLRSIRQPALRIVVEAPGTNDHPLYSLLAHSSISAFGESPWALRLPACLFGIASVWMVYQLGSLLTNRMEAWAGASILATSYHHIWFSQNARGYTMLGFFTLTATYLLLRARQSRRPRDYAWYAITCVAAIYTHLTMVWLVAGHAAALIGEGIIKGRSRDETDWRPLLWSWTAVAAVSVLAYAPALPRLVNHFVLSEPRAAAKVATPTWAVLQTISEMLAGAGVPVALATAALAGVGALSLMRRAPLPFALLVMPGAVAAAGLLVLGQAVRPRFFFFLSGAAAIFVGRGLGAIAGAIGRIASKRASESQPAVLVASVLLIVAASAMNLPSNYRVPKQDFVGARRFLEDQERNGAKVAAVGLACSPMNRYFEKTWPCLASADDFDAYAEQEESKFLVYTLAQYIDDPSLQRRVLDGCHVARTFPGTLGNGEVVVCEPQQREAP